MVKFVWVVGTEPTGRYRSFERRSWPTAHYAHKDKEPAAQIYCEDSYVPRLVKTGQHAELKVVIYDYSVPSNTTTGSGFTRRALKQRFKTLAEAKKAAEDFLVQHQQYRPTEYRS